MLHDQTIVTLTPNPTIDLASEAAKVVPTRKIRTRNERYDAGGGGVNVSRVIRELGGETLAVVLAGGAIGSFLEQLLDSGGVPRHTVPIAGLTRISHVVQDLEKGEEYRFVPPGPTISGAEWQAALDTLAEVGGGWLVLSGSKPPGLAVESLADAARAAKARGQKVVVDSSGAALKAALAVGGLEMVKPSIGEFEALLDRPLRDPAAQEAAAQELARSGAARLVVVTLGHKGAVMATAERVWRLPAPDVEVRGASGAGDSFVAAMTLALARGESDEEAFAWGNAAGGATVAQSGTAHAERAEVERLFALSRAQLRG